MPKSVAAKRAEAELQEFLSSKPLWLQKILQLDTSSVSPDDLLKFLEYQAPDFMEMRAKYEAIIQRIPGAWKKYRQKAQKEGESALGLKKGKPGRPRDDEVAKRVQELKAEGKTGPRIQDILNKEFGESRSLHSYRMLDYARKQKK